MKKLKTFGAYLRKKYKVKVKKIPLAISGFTCPNIDGTVAKGGCTFCENDSFSPNVSKNKDKIFLNLNSKSNPLLQKQLLQVKLQLSQGKKEFSPLGYKKYLAYFQAFTNTYAPFDTLKALYEEALNQKDIIGLSIGTRSDSVQEKVYEYLSELSLKKEVWIEFGIQSFFDETLERINRGHDSKSIIDAIQKAKKYKLNVCGHLIFGLPGENKAMMLESSKKAFELGIDSVKFHPLYVVKNTLLANEYKRGEFKPISMQEYLEVLTEAINIMPKHIIIQRVTAGIEDDTLLAPAWCGKSKNYQMAQIRKTLLKKGYLY